MSTKFLTLETNKGTIVAELFRRDCPGTVENFEKLASAGYYLRTRFHRFDAEGRLYGGDPLSRDLEPGDPALGTGGPGYTIPCETIGNRNKHVMGAISMAHNGTDTGGSQFFFVLNDEGSAHLNGRHTVFGKVTEGLEVLRTLELNDVVMKASVWE